MKILSAWPPGDLAFPRGELLIISDAKVMREKYF
jgi:hypothetical protein